MPEFVTLTTRPTEFEAQMMASRLEADGISCLLAGNRVTSVVGPVTELNTSWSNPLGGVELKVAAEDLAAARSILKEYDTAYHDENDVVRRPANFSQKMAQAYVGFVAAALFAMMTTALWPPAPFFTIFCVALAAFAVLIFNINRKRRP